METTTKSFSEPTLADTPYTGSYEGEFRMDTGYPLYPYPAAEQWAKTGSFGYFSTGPGGVDSQYWNAPVASFDRVITNEVRVLTSSFAVIVPMYDAEAVFFDYAKVDEVTQRERITTPIQGTGWASTYGFRIKNGHTVYIYTDPYGVPVYGFAWDGTWTQGGNATRYQRSTPNLGEYGDTTIDATVPPPTVDSSTKLCSREIVDADIDAIYFHGDDADTAPAISAWSSASEIEPVILSPGHIDPVNSTDRINSAIIGWI